MCSEDPAPRRQSILTDQSHTLMTPASRPRAAKATKVIILSIILLLLMLSLIAQAGSTSHRCHSGHRRRDAPAIRALNSQLPGLRNAVFVLLRNVLKLVRERRTARLGSKFKLRLVSYAIGLSLLPVLLLFFSLSGFCIAARSLVRRARAADVDDAASDRRKYSRRRGGPCSSARAIARGLSPAG